MARFRHLPLYHGCYAFTREYYKLLCKLPKALKYGIGLSLFQSSVKCIQLVILANGSEKKGKALTALSLELEQISVLLRLLHDFQGISRGEYGVFSERLANLSTQVGAWRKWDRRESRPKTSVEVGDTG
jgi:hypothetical protein